MSGIAPSAVLERSLLQKRSEDRIKLREDVVVRASLLMTVKASRLRKGLGLFLRAAALFGEAEIGPALGEALLIFHRGGEPQELGLE